MKQHSQMGTSVSKLTPEEKESLRINFGLKIVGPITGLLKGTNLTEGFVITTVDGKPVKSIKQLELQLETERGVMIEGIYPDGIYARYFSKGFQNCDQLYYNGDKCGVDN